MVTVVEVVYDILVSNERRQDRSPPISSPALPLPPPPPHGPDADVEPVLFATGSAPHLYEASDAAYHLRELEDKLQRCLATLTLHFQPIVYAGTRARFGYEALLRSADRSLPNPGAILDAAERLERTATLGRNVRAQAAKVIASAPAERGLMFVNLHLLDLFDKQLLSPFAPLSKVASRVVLEITERTSLEGQIDLRYRVAELRELGFHI